MYKVCMITQSSYPADPRVRREAEVLEKAGFKVDIVCLLRKEQVKIEKFGNVTAFRILGFHRNESLSKYLLQSFLFFLGAFWMLLKLTSKNRYDLIQIHNMPDTHVFITIFHKLHKVPIVLDLHDLTPELFESKWGGTKNKSLIRLVKYFEKLSTLFADQLITASGAFVDLLIKRGVEPKKITLVLNTPNEDIFRFNERRKYKIIDNNLRLIYHGTVAERFGIHIAIESMGHIIKKIPGASLNVYGTYDDEYKTKLINLISVFNLTENVELGGSFLLEDIYRFITDSDIGVVPYMNNLYMNIALSTKMFEYAASGIPIVASRLKAPSLIFNDDSISYFKPEDPVDLADKTIALAFNPERRRTQALRAQNILGSISWSLMGERYLRLITKTIAKSSTKKASIGSIFG